MYSRLFERIKVREGRVTYASIYTFVDLVEKFESNKSVEWSAIIIHSGCYYIETRGGNLIQHVCIRVELIVHKCLIWNNFLPVFRVGDKN